MFHIMGFCLKPGQTVAGFTMGLKTPATIPMQREADNTFHTALTATGSRELNFCFKDSAQNWDNNNGWNWSCPIY